MQAEIDKLKATIAELNEALEDAQARQKAVQAEAKKLEKDMAEFKNNKNGKIDELKVRFLIAGHHRADSLYRKRLRSKSQLCRSTTSC